LFSGFSDLLGGGGESDEGMSELIKRQEQTTSTDGGIFQEFENSLKEFASAFPTQQTASTSETGEQTQTQAEAPAQSQASTETQATTQDQTEPATQATTDGEATT
jgi:hypothetical protein